MFTKKWKHRSHKRQQETITDQLCEAGTEGSGERLIDSSVIKLKLDFLNGGKHFASNQKTWNVETSSVDHNALDTMLR